MEMYRLRIKTPPVDERGEVIQSPKTYIYRCSNYIRSHNKQLFLAAAVCGLFSIIILIIQSAHDGVSVIRYAIHLPSFYITPYCFYKAVAYSSV